VNWFTAWTTSVWMLFQFLSDTRLIISLCRYPLAEHVLKF